MKYMGSKARIADALLQIMLPERQEGQWWVEPFVGGGNMIERVTGKRLGSDVSPNAISALISIRDSLHELPKTANDFSEAQYKALRRNMSAQHSAYAGFAFSYGGKWLGGWRRDSIGRRDYVAEAYRNAAKQSPKLQGCLLVCADYTSLALPAEPCLIYCDPPYAKTTKYASSFDHMQFWDTVRHWGHIGHTVFVSEYEAPSGFDCVWSGICTSSLTKNTGAKYGTERLFKYVRK